MRAPRRPPGPAADGVAAAGVPASVGTPRASATAPPAGPAALTALPGERDESTVKLTPAGPSRPRPRPSPRPRALGLVTGAGEPPLGIVEGPASATTKAPAAVARALGRAALVGDLFEPAGFRSRRRCAAA